MNGGFGYLGAAHAYRKEKLSELPRNEVKAMIDEWNKKTRLQKIFTELTPTAYGSAWIVAAKEIHGGYEQELRESDERMSRRSGAVMIILVTYIVSLVLIGNMLDSGITWVRGLVAWAIVGIIAGGMMSVANAIHRKDPELAPLRRIYWVAQGIIALTISGGSMAIVARYGFEMISTALLVFCFLGGVMFTFRGCAAKQV